jgi:hypothetical protein
LWVLGGRYDGDLTHRTFYLDPDATSWSEGPSLLYPVQHAQAASIDGTLYLVGGEYYGDATWFTQVLVPRLPAGDTDNDGDIDGADLARFAVVFDNRIDPDADLNEDRSIDDDDVASFTESFGK